MNPTFVVLNNSEIHAHAEEGDGGNITINSNQFISSNNSSIDASSKLGIDGDVQIESPTVNLDKFLVVLWGCFMEAQCLTKTHPLKVSFGRKVIIPR